MAKAGIMGQRAPRMLISTLLVSLLVFSGLMSGCAQKAPPSPPKEAGASDQKSPAQKSPAQDGKAPGEKIKIAIPSRTISVLPLQMAVEKDLFAQEGLDVQLVEVAPALAVAGVTSGEIDFITPLNTMVTASAKGVPIRTVSIILGKALHFLMAKPEIKTVADLKGKTIRVNAVGDLTDMEAKAALKKFGLRENEVNIIAVSPESSGWAVFREGKMDAAVLSTPFSLMAEEKGFRTLLDLEEAMPVGASGLATSQDKIAKNPEQVKKVIRATLRAIDQIRSDKAGALKVMTSWLKLDPGLAEKVYAQTASVYARDGKGSQKSLDTNVEVAAAAAKIEGKVGAAKVYDFGLLEQVVKELGR